MASRTSLGLEEASSMELGVEDGLRRAGARPARAAEIGVGAHSAIPRFRAYSSPKMMAIRLAKNSTYATAAP